MNPQIILITGPPGSGKTTLARQMCNDGRYKRWASMTTRLPRPKEIHGFDYHFVNEEYFESLRDDGLLLEYIRSDSGVYYGLPRPDPELLESGSCLVAIVDLDAATRLQNELAPLSVEILILDAPTETLLERMALRGDSKAEIEERGRIIEQEKRKITSTLRLDK